MNKKFIALSLISTLGITSATSVLTYAQNLLAAFNDAPVLTSSTKAVNETVVMNEQSDFRYLDNNTDPADGTLGKDKYGQYTAWTRPYNGGNNAELNGTYNDNDWHWTSGSFSSVEGNAKNKLGDSRAYFFRGRFNIDNPNDVYGLHLNFKYKDAVIVYINGRQLTAINVPDAGYNFVEADGGSHKDNMGYGSKNSSKDVQEANLYFRDISTMLSKGENIISFEVHKTNADSEGYFAMNTLGLNPDKSLLPALAPIKAISLSVGATRDQLNVNWFSTADKGGKLQYVEKSQMKGETFPEDKAVTVDAKTENAQAEDYYANKATFTNLKQNTEYVYRVGNEGTWSDVYTTTTKDDKDFSFLFAGDPQVGSSGDLVSDKDGWKNTLDLVKDKELFKDVDFIQNAGDHVEDGRSEIQYDAYLANYEGSTLYSLPSANAIGNHDYYGTDFNDHFNMPNVSKTLGVGQADDKGVKPNSDKNCQGDYYYVYNNTLMLVLNSNNRSTAEHQQFIEHAIQSTQNQNIKWKIVVFHHSIYSTASHASDGDIIERRNSLAPMLTKEGIDLVLMGHDHVYTRSMLMDGLNPLKEESFDKDGKAISEVTDPQGITYITANSASGSKYYEFSNNIQGDYVAVKNQEHVANISKIDISDNQLKIVTYRTKDLSVVDEFTINKTNKTETDKLDEAYKQIAELKDTIHKLLESHNSLANKYSDLMKQVEELLADKDATQNELDKIIAELEQVKQELSNLKDEANKPSTDKNDSTVNTDKDDSGKDSTQGSPVKTGDNTQLVATVAALGISAVLGATIYISKKKEN